MFFIFFFLLHLLWVKNHGIFIICMHALMWKENLKLFIIFIGINARAPPEPYYGRLIGNFTEFAHGIKVTISGYSILLQN